MSEIATLNLSASTSGNSRSAVRFMTQLSRANLDKAFALLVECAVKGERCPITAGPKAHPFLRPDQITALKREGRIKITIGGPNWRVVTILTGKHAGKSTAAAPSRVKAPLRTRTPSAPRPLAAAELFR